MKKGFAAVWVVVIVIVTIVAVLSVTSKKSSKKSSPVSFASESPIIQNSVAENKVSAHRDIPNSELEKYLTVEVALLGVSDNISLYFKSLTSSNEVSIDPTKSWIPASTIKSFVVPEAFRQRRLGLIDFNDTVVISAKNVVPTELETDEFPRLREGVVVSISQLVEAMIEQSDNIAYNTLLDVLDRRNINFNLRNLGITETVVGEKLNLDDEQFAIDLKVPGRQPVTTSAKDLATLFDLMYRNKIPNSEEMLDIFKRQKINNMIPVLLPDNLVVAHKSGEWAPIYHDGGIVYKENAPFVLSVFTNSNDPSVISKIARVAYFQDAKSIGRGIEKIQSYDKSKVGRRARYYLAAGDIPSQKVLAAGTSEKMPKVTAADLGITLEDLQNNAPAGLNVKKALISVGSPFYGIKRFVDDLRLKFARSGKHKLDTNLSLSRNRLAEFENEIQRGNITNAFNLLEQSEQYLKQSVVESQSSDVGANGLLKIKQANDLNFETLAKIAQDLPDDRKEAFVDTVYQFVQSNRREIKPTINKSLAAAKSTNQEPIIGTVANITNNSMTIKFDDGSTKEAVITESVPARDFNSLIPDKKAQFGINSKVAIVGQIARDGKIVPQFILRNIPNNIPDKRSGTVVDVDPSKSTLKIVTPDGVQKEAKVDDKTQIQSRDTTVSLEGIKAGSQVVVSGRSQNADNQTSEQSQNKTSSTQTPINAATITVTKNSSGLKEQKSSSDQQRQKDQGKKEEQKNPPKKEELQTPKKEERQTPKKEDKK